MSDLSKLQHGSPFNYQQVYLDGSSSVNAATATVTHNLGYIPFIRIWAEQIAGEISKVVTLASTSVYHSAYQSAPDVLNILTTTTALSFTNSANGPVTVRYRIYVDVAV